MRHRFPSTETGTEVSMGVLYFAKTEERILFSVKVLRLRDQFELLWQSLYLEMAIYANVSSSFYRVSCDFHIPFLLLFHLLLFA